MPIDCLADVRIRMDGVNDFDIIPPSEADEGRADLIEAVAKAFAAMRRNEAAPFE